MAAFILRPQRLAAFGTEFRALRARTATRAQSGSFGSKVNAFGQILPRNLHFHLLYGLLCLGGRKFCLEIRRAFVTEHALRVPAGSSTNPMRAFGTLAEARLGFIHGFVKSLVMRWTLYGALDFIGAITCRAENTAKKIARRTQRASGHTRNARFEFRHAPVAASVAKKLKLKAFVGRMIRMVARELNQSHVVPWGILRK